MKNARGILLLLCLLSFAACKSEEPPPKSNDKPGETPASEAAIDPEIAAVASAAARGADPGSQVDDTGPPADGILNPAKAESEARLGEPPKVVLGSDGKAPRLALGTRASLPTNAEQGTIQVMLQSDPSAGSLPIDFDVTLTFSKPKAPPELPHAVLTVRGAKLGMQGGAGAEELNAKLGKLKGGKVEFSLESNGAGSGFRWELPKGGDPQFEDVLQTLAEGLATLVLPYPDKPVGLDAYWMVTNREKAMGLDVVSYRMVKVVKLSGDQVSLSVNLKRYVVGSRFDVPRVSANGPMEIERFESAAEGTLEVAKDRPLPLSGQVNLMLSAMLKPNAVYQSQSGVRLNFGGGASMAAPPASQ